MSGSQKVLYILSTSRGGSTIVGGVLGCSPGFAFAGEVRRLWEHGLGPGRACGCGLLLDDCPVWSVVLEKVLVGGITAQNMSKWQAEYVSTSHPWRSTFELFNRRTATDDGFTAYRAAMARTWRALSDAYGSEILIDSSKLPGDAGVLVAAPDTSPYLLHLVRDARGVLASQLRRRKVSVLGRWRRLAYGAAAWDARHVKAGRLRKSSAPYLMIHYEDFVQDPSATVARIRAFTGTEPADFPLTSALHLAEVHTPRGPHPARTVELKTDVRWRDELSALEAGAVQLFAYPWQRRYGYASGGQAEPYPGYTHTVTSGGSALDRSGREA